MSEQKFEIPASLLKLEELRLDSIQYCAQVRALEDRRQELRSKLHEVREYERALADARPSFGGQKECERYDTHKAAQANLARALVALLEMVEAEQERISVFATTADLFRRAEEHYRSEVTGWARDAI